MITFDYLEKIVVEGQLEVEDIGDCVIMGRNDIAEEFYLVIRTYMGWTEILEYGPCVPDLDILPTNVTLKYSRFEFNMPKLEKLIDKFLNDGKRMISYAQVVEIEDVEPQIQSDVKKMFISKNINMEE